MLDCVARRCRIAPLAALLLLVATTGSAAVVVEARSAIEAYGKLPGRVVLDNARVIARKFVLEPRQDTGPHAHPEPELIVFIKGGVVTLASSGRSVLWRDARVAWNAPSPTASESWRNAGKNAIEFIQVVLKPQAADAATAKSEFFPVVYPNVALEDLLENDRVLVQRYQLLPGQWEGVHAHPAHSLYIFVKGGDGGHWMSRTTNPPTEVRGYSADGDVGWMEPVGILAGHQSGNIGKAACDALWIILKD